VGGIVNSSRRGNEGAETAENGSLGLNYFVADFADEAENARMNYKKKSFSSVLFPPDPRHPRQGCSTLTGVFCGLCGSLAVLCASC